MPMVFKESEIQLSIFKDNLFPKEFSRATKNFIYAKKPILASDD